MSDEKAKIKEISEKKHHRAKVTALIILSIVLPVGAIWGAIAYSIIGPYDYSRGFKELEKAIPRTVQLHRNNKDELRRIALQMEDDEVISNLNITYKTVTVSSAFHSNKGVFFNVDRIDLSDLVIVYKPDFEYYFRHIAYCKNLSDDWYILIINSPRG